MGGLESKGVRWTANLIHPIGWRRGWTIVLKAYLDGSGKATDDRVVVAGFVADTETWEKFEALWVRFLSEFGIQRFHAAPYWAKERPFHDWTEAKWLMCRREISRIFADVRPTGIGVGVTVSAFSEWRDNLDRYYLDDPYYYCIDYCLYELIRRLNVFPHDEGVVIYCDQENEHEKIGKEIAKWHERQLRKDNKRLPGNPDPNRHVGTYYGSSFDYRPLQAADIFAHGCFQFIPDYENAETPLPEESFLPSIFGACPVSAHIFKRADDIALHERMRSENYYMGQRWLHRGG